MSTHVAEQLKTRGNECFRQGEYTSAITLYSQAIQQNPNNPRLWTNRANARLKLQLWDEVINDCLRSIELSPDNTKAYYFLGQAQLQLHHPNEALSSALRAYELCCRTSDQSTSTFAISGFVLKCKKAKWDLRERDRLRHCHQLLAELEVKLEMDMKRDLDSLEQRRLDGQVGSITAAEESKEIENTACRKINDLRNVFAISHPSFMEKREIPSYLIDSISFELMHDPVITKHGHSYERATITEHLKRNPADPLTRDPLLVHELRPNLALREACDEFWKNNSGWAYKW